MAEVSIYVALITAAAGVVGAGIPQASIIYRDVRQASRDHRDRQDEAIQEACLDLLRTAADLRVQVANVPADGEGSSMAKWLTDIRKYAAAAGIYATSVQLRAPGALAGPAEALAQAASRMATATEENTSLGLGGVIREPDFRELDKCAEEFRLRVIAEIQRSPKGSAPVPRPVAAPHKNDGAA